MSKSDITTAFVGAWMLVCRCERVGVWGRVYQGGVAQVYVVSPMTRVLHTAPVPRAARA